MLAPHVCLQNPSKLWQSVSVFQYLILITVMMQRCDAERSFVLNGNIVKHKEGMSCTSPGIYGLVRVFTVKSGFRLWRIRMSTKFGNLRSIYGENWRQIYGRFPPILGQFPPILGLPLGRPVFRVISAFFGFFVRIRNFWSVYGNYWSINGYLWSISGAACAPFFHPARIAILENCRNREESG